MRFSINIRRRRSPDYEVYETSAPSDYDGFGTITVADYGTERTVLIRHEHASWQLGRYQSGNHITHTKPSTVPRISRTSCGGV